MLRRFKKWVNRRCRLCGFAPLFLSACNLPPAPPNPPTDAGATTATSTTGATLPERCAAACARFKADGCTQSDKVCAKDGFDDAGECTTWLDCQEACEETPEYYLDEACEL